MTQIPSLGKYFCKFSQVAMLLAIYLIGQLVGVYSNIQTGLQYDGVTPITTKVMFDFFGKMESGELQTSNESLEVGWFEEEKVLDLITHPIFHYRAKNLLNFDGKVVYSAFSKNPFEIHIESNI